MELSLLYYFKTVAEQENITKAAELLYISQPALSKAIAKLEKVWTLRCSSGGKGASAFLPWGGYTTNMCPLPLRCWNPEKRNWRR